MTILVRVLVILATVGVTWSLAILGWGGAAALFAHPALVGMAVLNLALAALAGFSEGGLRAGAQEDRSNRWVLSAFTLLTVLDCYLAARTDRMDVLTFGGEGVRWAGVAVTLAGGVLRLWPVFVLGQRFSGLVAIQPGHTLVTSGIYRLIRHPSYLGMLISTLGWGMAFRSWVGVLFTLLFIPPLLARIRAEERLLGSHFGAGYEAYRARTWRLLPGIF
jgi:protein-S-isoprenylcysteine O-methyltransferase Ste14